MSEPRPSEVDSMRPRGPVANAPQTQLWQLIGIGLILAAVYVLRLALPMSLRDYIDQPLIDMPRILGETTVAAWYYVDTVLLLFGLYYVGYRIVLAAPAYAPPMTGLLELGPIVVLLPVLFAVALLLMFPVTAGDLFVYIFFGRIWVFQGLNPYITSPDMWPFDITSPYTVFPELATVYGALFTHLSAGLAWLAGDSLLRNVLLFKGAMVGFHALAALCVYLILKQTRPHLAWAGVFLVWWNPLVHFNAAGDGHNDITMMALVMVAFWLASRGRWSLACAMLVLSGSMKWVSFILIPIFALGAVRAIGWRRWTEIVGGLLTGFGVAALVHAPFYVGITTVLGSVPEIGSQFTASLATVLRDIFSGYVELNMAETWARLAVYGLFGVLYLVTLFRVRGDFDSIVYSSYQAFFLYLVVGTLWFQPWYVTWLVGLGALLVGTPVALRTLVFSGTAMLIHAVTGFGFRVGWLGGNRPLLQLLTMAVVFAVPVIMWLSESHPIEDR